MAHQHTELETSYRTSLSVTTLLVAFAALVLIASPATAAPKVTLSTKAPSVTSEVSLTVSGLKPKRTYLVLISASDSSLISCGPSGTYENGQLAEYTRKRSSKKGVLKVKLSPQRALGTNWCLSTYKGKVKLASNNRSVASFAFKVKKS